MEITSTEILNQIEEVISSEGLPRETNGDSPLCRVMNVLRHTLEEAYKQSTYNFELRNVCSMAEFVIYVFEREHDFGMYEDGGDVASLSVVSESATKAINVFWKGNVEETGKALEQVNITVGMADRCVEARYGEPGEYATISNVAKFITTAIAKQMQKEELESATDEAA